MDQHEYDTRLYEATVGTGWGYWVVRANKSGWYWLGDPEAKPDHPPVQLTGADPSYPVDVAWDSSAAPWPPPNWAETFTPRP